MEPFDPSVQQKSRNTFLIVLCILTFIDAGSSFLQMLLMPLYAIEENAEMALNFYSKLGSSEMSEQMSEIIAAAQALPSWYFIIASLPFLITITAGVFLLNKKPLGFHLYVISQILAFVCQNFLLKEPFQMSWISIICAIIISICYYVLLKNLRKDQESDQQQIDF